ncbi:UNVERIFIED_CONTAM: hypothetical protein GTU68_048489 [Idotea baltica]|nr:hypothetical protein [Idotea baltica]
MGSKTTKSAGKWSKSKTDTINLVEYDSNWPTLFEEERSLLTSVIPSKIDCSIKHFGSTSVVGLVAKPIIDILITLDNTELWPELISPIESLEYLYWKDNPEKNHMFFVKGMPPFGQGRTHHVHVLRSQDAKERLAFCEALNRRPDLLAEYAILKTSLASKHEFDRDKYTEAKSSFINNALKETT